MRIVQFAVVACLMPSAAFADWQFTRWNMTPNQVVAASKGTATPTTEQPMDLVGSEFKLTAPYSAGDFQFKAYFAFDSQNRLSLVMLDLASPNRAELLMSLNNRYGAGTKASLIEWNWRTSRDNVAFRLEGEHARVFYGRRIGSREKGL